MITSLARLTALPGMEAEMRAALARLATTVAKRGPGMATYVLHTVEGQPGVFLFFEQCEGDATRAARREAELLKALDGALRDIAACHPEITRLNLVARVER